MRHIIDDQVVLSRRLEDPLAPQIGAFVRIARGDGFARQSRYRRVPLQGLVDGLDSTLSDCGASHPSIRNSNCDLVRDGCRCIKACGRAEAVGVLRRDDLILKEKVASRRLTPVEQEARMFEHYLRDDRSLARATRVNYVLLVRGFLMDR